MDRRYLPTFDFSSIEIRDIDIDALTRVYDCDDQEEIFPATDDTELSMNNHLSYNENPENEKVARNLFESYNDISADLLAEGVLLRLPPAQLASNSDDETYAHQIFPHKYQHTHKIKLALPNYMKSTSKIKRFDNENSWYYECMGLYGTPFLQSTYDYYHCMLMTAYRPKNSTKNSPNHCLRVGPTSMSKDRIDPIHTLNSSSTNMLSKVNVTRVLNSSNAYNSNSYDCDSIDNLECCMCKINIEYNFYLFKNMFYCRDHYKNTAGNYCVVCEQIDVKGPIIKINNVDVHTECFECSICYNYIDQNEAYSLYNNKNFLCYKCMSSLDISSQNPKLPTTQIPTNSPHHLYFIKYYTKDHLGCNGAQFNIELTTVPFSQKNSISGTVVGNLKKVNMSKELLTDSNLFLSSPTQGLKVTKFESLNATAQQYPPIFENDVLVMVNDLPCIKENSFLITEILVKKFPVVKVIYLLRAVKDRNYSANLDASSPQTDSPPSIEYKSIISRFGQKSKKKLLSNANSSTSMLDLKFSSKNSTFNDLNTTMSSSILPNSDVHIDKFDYLLNQSDDALYSYSTLSPEPNKRYSYRGHKDSKYNFVQNNLERSQSQTLYHNHGQVFTENDLIIKESLGEGFFGKALKVMNKQTHEEYAMKILKVVNNLTLNNFRKEVQLMKSVHHPNLVRFIGVILTPESINVLMEFISGGTLKRYIESIRKNTKSMFTPKQMYSMVLGMSSGMAYLHSKNIAHRDLTSSNCLLQDHKKLNVVISDFGLSEVITQKHTRLAVVGSPYWMAPEMLNGKIYDIKVDIFSFGIIICEITTLLDASPDFLKRNKDFSLDIESYLNDLQPNVPPKLSSLAMKCCDMDPNKRPLFSNIYNIVSLDYGGYEQKSRRKTKR